MRPPHRCCTTRQVKLPYTLPPSLGVSNQTKAGSKAASFCSVFPCLAHLISLLKIGMGRNVLSTSVSGRSVGDARSDAQEAAPVFFRQIKRALMQEMLMPKTALPGLFVQQAHEAVSLGSSIIWLRSTEVNRDSTNSGSRPGMQSHSIKEVRCTDVDYQYRRINYKLYQN